MNLKQGHYYHLELNEPYKSKGPLFVYFTAIVRRSTMHLYGDFDIRETFFNDVGLSTYLSLVDDETDILICSPITSTDPIQIDDKNAFALPASIIDLSNSEEWFKNQRFIFELHGVDRYIPSVIDQAEFKLKVAEEITHFCTMTDSLVGDLISVNNSETEFLKSQSEIEKSNSHREETLNARIIRNREILIANETEYVKLIKERNRIERATELNEKQIKQIAKDRDALTILNDKHINFMSKINIFKDGLRLVYEDVKAEAIKNELPIPEFEAMWDIHIGNDIPIIIPND